MATKKAVETVKTILRIPVELHPVLVEASAADSRSMNNFIIAAIREKLARGDWLDDAVVDAQRSRDDGK